MTPGKGAARQIREQLRDARPRLHWYDEDDELRFVHAHSQLRHHVNQVDVLRRATSDLVTADPASADVHLLPTNLLVHQFTDVHAMDYPRPPRPVTEWVQQLEHLGGAPHAVLATGDFGQRRRSRHESHAPHRAYREPYAWLDDRFALLSYESTPDLGPLDVGLLAAPVVAEPPPLRRRFRERQLPQRDLLYSFAGAMAYPDLPADHVRGGRLQALVPDSPVADAFVGTAQEARHRFGRRGGTDLAMLQRSTFTLCPAGFGRWTFRLGQALRYGSVPVVISDDYVLPHAQHVDWDSCVIVVPESELETVPERLRAVPADEVAARQAALADHRELFTLETVADMALLELLTKVRRAARTT